MAWHSRTGPNARNDGWPPDRWEGSYGLERGGSQPALPALRVLVLVLDFAHFCRPAIKWEVLAKSVGQLPGLASDD